MRHTSWSLPLSLYRVAGVVQTGYVDGTHGLPTCIDTCGACMHGLHDVHTHMQTHIYVYICIYICAFLFVDVDVAWTFMYGVTSYSAYIYISGTTWTLNSKRGSASLFLVVHFHLVLLKEHGTQSEDPRRSCQDKGGRRMDE